MSLKWFYCSILEDHIGFLLSCHPSFICSVVLQRCATSTWSLGTSCKTSDIGWNGGHGNQSQSKWPVSTWNQRHTELELTFEIVSNQPFINLTVAIIPCYSSQYQFSTNECNKNKEEEEERNKERKKGRGREGGRKEGRGGERKDRIRKD